MMLIGLINLFAVGLVAVLSVLTVKKRNGKVAISRNPMLVIFLVYGASAISAMLMNERVLPSFDLSSHSTISYIGYSFLLALSLLPSIFLKGYKIRVSSLPSGTFVKLSLYVASILIIYSLVYQLPYAVKAVGLGAAAVRYDLNINDSFILPDSFATTVAVGVSSFYVVFLIMFFVALARGGSRFILLSMFLGGASYVVSSLAFAARDGVVFYLLTFVFVYSLFRDELAVKVKKRIAAIGAAMIAVCLVLLAAFTMQRFWVEQDSARLLYGTVGYLGQQPYVFAETVEKQDAFYGLDLRFPVFAELFSGKADQVVRTEVYEWSFGTFLKDYYGVGGWAATIGLTVLGVFLFSFAFFRKKKSANLSYLLMVGLYFQLMTSGVFYLRLGTRGGNLYLIMMAILIAVVLFYEKLAAKRSGVYARGLPQRQVVSWESHE